MQWGLTCVNVDPVTNKTLAVDLQFLPYNKRDRNQITPLVVQKMMEGGTMTTDSWKAYPGAAEAAQVSHYVVNHSKTFKDPETGACTNNVEGIHGVIKKDGQQQFGRLPYLTDEGNTYYLDLLIWRANKRLMKIPFFYAFSLDLWYWTRYPLEDFVHIIPVFEEFDVDDDDGNDDSAEEHEEGDGDDAWFIQADQVIE